MKNTFKFALIVSISTLLAVGCSSNPDKEMAERLATLEKAELDRIAERQAAQQAQRKEELETSPRWFLSPPEADGTGFYGVGYARSKQMGHALKAARLQAEFELAKMYRQELSGSERAFERGNNEGDVIAQTTFLIDKIVDAVPVVGYTVVEQKMVPLNGVFETFVLLKLPYDEFNKVLQSQRERELDKTVQASFDDLERRLNNRRAQREQEAQANFEREQEAIRNRADMLNKGVEAGEPKANPNDDQVQKPAIPAKAPLSALRSIVGG
ncbi:MAG: hypothetical protein CML21_00330 [Rheinheimera sp.]|nr:hypothetical protein [Rheinheimera sp.]|tara:strand:- start:131 stop:937 length:807 start_codon:yes stop_codon:yes gene_type:complete